jgi:hypothetical protein
VNHPKGPGLCDLSVTKSLVVNVKRCNIPLYRVFIALCKNIHISYMAQQIIRGGSSKRRTRRHSKKRKVLGGEGGASDYGVKVWGYDQVAVPNQGNFIKANPITGGGIAAPFMNTPPSMDPVPSIGDMTKQAIDAQNTSMKQMTIPQINTAVQSDSAAPKMSGGRKSRRLKRSKRKYGHKIRNGRRTKTVY